MGVLFGYYSAADDEAARAILHGDGWSRPGTGCDQIEVKGIDPVVDLLPAEALITGRPADLIRADARHGHLIGVVGEGEAVTVSLTDHLRDSLADLDADLLGDVALGWAASGSFYRPPDREAIEDFAAFLRDLAALASRAVARDHRLYCWICP